MSAALAVTRTVRSTSDQVPRGKLEGPERLRSRRHPLVECQDDARSQEPGQGKMERIGCSQGRTRSDRQQQTLGLAMGASRQVATLKLPTLDVTQDTLVYTPGVCPRHLIVPDALRESRRQLGDREIRYHDIAAADQDCLQLIGPGLRHVELGQGAGVDIHGARRDLHARPQPCPRAAALSVEWWSETADGRRLLAATWAPVERSAPPAGHGPSGPLRGPSAPPRGGPT